MKRIDKLLYQLHARFPSVPTFEQFQETWASMDEISKSVYVAQAECPELLGEHPTEYEAAVTGYIERMGLVKAHYTIADILEGRYETTGQIAR